MIYELLRHGCRNAISVAELSNMTGMGERMVREMIERERFDGHLILSGNKGYYLPDENPLIAQLEVNTWSTMRTLTATTLMRSVQASHCSEDCLGICGRFFFHNGPAVGGVDQ